MVKGALGLRGVHVLVLVLMSAMGWGASAGATGYWPVGFDHDHPSHELSRTRLTIQQGHAELNRFDVIRIQRMPHRNRCLGAHSLGHHHGGWHRADPAIILLAPFGFPAEFWELTDDGSYEDAFAPQLALAGYDVWLVDSRLAAAEPGQCESGELDCSVMVDWGVETAVKDAMYVRQLVRFANPRSRPVIGGFSGGSSTALATINRHPKQFAGLFLWEGTLHSDDPDTQARNAAFCTADEALLSSGVAFDASVQVFKTLFVLAETDPSGPSPIPVFPPGTTNLQALLFALTLPDATNPLNFTDGFVRFVGDPIATTLAHSDLDRVLGWGDFVGNYAPIAFIRDTHCAIGGSDTSFTNRLHKFKGDVLVYSAGLGFNSMMLDTAAKLTRADVTIEYQPSFGESDFYAHVDWENVALDPLLDWLDDVY